MNFLLIQALRLAVDEKNAEIRDKMYHNDENPAAY